VVTLQLGQVTLFILVCSPFYEVAWRYKTLESFRLSN